MYISTTRHLCRLVGVAGDKSQWRLTLHQYSPQKLQDEIEFLFLPSLLDFEGINLVSLVAISCQSVAIASAL